MSVASEIAGPIVRQSPNRQNRFGNIRIGSWTPVICLLSLPFVLMLVNPDVFLTSGRAIDGWLYYGYYLNLPDYLNTFSGTYYGSRLSVIVPGWLVYKVFPPLIANYVLHLLLYYICVFSLYRTVSNTLSQRAGFLSAAFFGCFHLVLAPLSSDYVDAYGITYLFLAVFLMTRASESRRWQWYLAGAGLCSAALAIANTFYCVLILFLAAYYLFANYHGRRNSIVRSVFWYSVGVGGSMLGLCLLNYSMGGEFWFFLASIRWIFGHVQNGENPAYISPRVWFPQAYWTHYHLVVAVGAMLTLLHRSKQPTKLNRFNTYFQWQFLIALSAFAAFETSVFVMSLSYSYYLSLLIPFCALSLAGQLYRVTTLISEKKYTVLAVAAAVLFVLSSVAIGPWLTSSVILRLIFASVGLCAVVLMRVGVKVGTVLCIVLLLAVFNVVSNQLGQFGRSTGKCASICPFPWDGNRLAVFRTVADCMEKVESLDNSGNMYFWYDSSVWAKEGLSPIYDAVASTHLWGYRIISRDFPRSDNEVAPGTTIAVLTKQPHAEKQIKAALRKTLAVEFLKRTSVGTAPYVFDMIFLKTRRVRQIDQATEPIFDKVLRPGSLVLTGDDKLRSFPLRMLEPPFSATTRFKAIGAKMEITTPATKWAHSCRFPLLSVAQEGNYIFEMTYEPLEGDVDFGLMNEKQNSWMERAHQFTTEGTNGRRKVKFFRKHLTRGQPFHIWMSNRHPDGPKASRIVIHRITVYREANPENQ